MSTEFLDAQGIVRAVKNADSTTNLMVVATTIDLSGTTTIQGSTVVTATQGFVAQAKWQDF